MGIYIYTIIQGGEVVYVGSTTNPKARLQQHRKRFPRAVMKIIRAVSTIAQSNRIEGQVTRAYFRKGLAEYSVDCMPVCSRRGFPKYKVGKQVFCSKQELGRHFSISIHCINQWIRHPRSYFPCGREMRHTIKVLA